MTEIEAFIYFKKHQLHSVDFSTGQLNVTAVKANQYGKHTAVINNVGSRNEDGYIRLWCGNKKTVGARLCMRHRLLYWLYYGEFPEHLEVDHINRMRGDDRIDNLRLLNRRGNCLNSKQGRKKGSIDISTVTEVCKLLATTTMSDLDIAKQCNVSRPYVRDIKTRRRQSKLSTVYEWPHRIK